MPLLVTIGPQLAIVFIYSSPIVGAPGLIQFNTTGAVGPVNWQLDSSTLPAEWTDELSVTDGIASLDTSEVLLAGIYSVRVTATDTTRQPVTRTFIIRVVSLPLSVSASLPAFTFGAAYAGSALVEGGFLPYSFVNATLPAGVTPSFSIDTVSLAGTPTSGEGVPAGTTGIFNVSITVQDSDPEGATQFTFNAPIDFTVPALTITGTPLVDAAVGDAYSDALTVAGGVGGYSLMSFTGLPDGLSAILSGSTITISGTPDDGTDSGSPYSLSVTAEDADGNETMITPTLAVESPPATLASTIIALGPLWYAKLDESTPITNGQACADSSGNGVLLTYGSTAWTNTAGLYSGSSAGKKFASTTFIDVPAYTRAVGDPFSISFFIKGGIATTGKRILSVTTASTGFRLDLGGPGFDGYPRLTIFNPASTAASATSPVLTNSPHHVVVTFSFASGSGRVRFYIDGVAAGDLSSVLYAPVGTSWPTVMGTNAFANELDEVAYWDKELTAAEALSIWDARNLS